METSIPTRVSRVQMRLSSKRPLSPTHLRRRGCLHHHRSRCSPPQTPSSSRRRQTPSHTFTTTQTSRSVAAQHRARHLCSQVRASVMVTTTISNPPLQLHSSTTSACHVIISPPTVSSIIQLTIPGLPNQVNYTSKISHFCTT